MDKSNINAATSQEFSSLEKVLVETADDATRCLKLLKKNLSDYDSRHGNHFIHTAVSHMRSGMRNAKDTAIDLKRVAHDIKKSPQPTKSDIHAARNSMGATAKAMDDLQMTARNYDENKGRSKGMKGTVDNAVGYNDKENHENEGDIFQKSDDKNNKQSKFGRLFGKGNKDKKDKNIGVLGKSEKGEDDLHSKMVKGKGDCLAAPGGSALGGSETVETLVKSTLRDHFDLDALRHQITLAEKSLTASPTSPTSSPTFVERAKEVVMEVKDKIMGDSSTSPDDGHDAHKPDVHDTHKHDVTP